ncbi:MAG: hypothetical protein HYR56_35460 [Acidobacteria bacterium]|nr:hypothetical protein [Acidobacteriota bacterium]MBI3424364.1 hypothetical protein [Acidobacteriota bacterium]
MLIHSIWQRKHGLVLATFFFALYAPFAGAQTTAFTYQGKLIDAGSPANGNYDLQFKLFDTATVGTGTQQGTPVVVSNTTVTAGVFTVQLDFGAGVFSGANRFLEIGVEPPSSGTFTTLGPRQPITATPYAIKSANTATADSLSPACMGCVSGTQIGSLPTNSGSYIQNTSTPQANSNFNISGNGVVGGSLTVTGGTLNGNGSGLTNVPGIFKWQVVTGTSQQAQSNTGYIATNASPVTITLPAAPNVGDTMRVSGAGAGGWQIAQNAGQSVIGANLFMAGVSWTPRESNRSWYSVASSADGSKLVALVRNGQIYTSAPSAGGNTTVGVAGSLTGGQSTAIELQYIGNGQFLPLSYVGVPVVR